MSAGLLVQGDGDHAGEDNQGGEEHFGNGGDEGGATGGGHGVGSHGTLHHQKIGAPVTERENEAESHDHAEPADSHGIFDGVA